MCLGTHLLGAASPKVPRLPPGDPPSFFIFVSCDIQFSFITCRRGSHRGTPVPHRGPNLASLQYRGTNRKPTGTRSIGLIQISPVLHIRVCVSIFGPVQFYRESTPVTTTTLSAVARAAPPHAEGSSATASAPAATKPSSLHLCHFVLSRVSYKWGRTTCNLRDRLFALGVVSVSL